MSSVNPMASIATAGVNASSLMRNARQLAETSKPANVKTEELDDSQREKLRDAERIGEAAQQFEAIFVRQLLKSAHFGKQGGPTGYGNMVVDALATGVTSQGGLGLARAIQASLMSAEMAKLGEDSS